MQIPCYYGVTIPVIHRMFVSQGVLLPQIQKADLDLAALTAGDRQFILDHFKKVPDRVVFALHTGLDISKVAPGTLSILPVTDGLEAKLPLDSFPDMLDEHRGILALHDLGSAGYIGADQVKQIFKVWRQILEDMTPQQEQLLEADKGIAIQDSIKTLTHIRTCLLDIRGDEATPWQQLMEELYPQPPNPFQKHVLSEIRSRLDPAALPPAHPCLGQLWRSLRDPAEMGWLLKFLDLAPEDVARTLGSTELKNLHRELNDIQTALQQALHAHVISMEETTEKFNRMMALWIGKHGSPELKHAFKSNYDCLAGYLRERLKKEHPGWSYVKPIREKRTPGSPTSVQIRERLDPSKEALILARKIGEGAKVGWVVRWFAGGVKKQGEGLVIEDYLGSYVIYWLLDDLKAE